MCLHAVLALADVEEVISKFVHNKKTSEVTANAIDGTSTASSTSVDFEKETTLPKNIKFNPSLQVTNESLAKLRWKNLFLTGATGFLGSFLLKQLICQPEEPVVRCLIRCKSPEDGMDRLKRSLGRFEVTLDNDQWNRVEICVGDLEAPQFGLTYDQFAQLAVWSDHIFHSGAWVNGVFDYNTLRNANVGGTLECLKLSCAASFHGKIVPLHHVSTVTVIEDRQHGRETHLAGTRPPSYAGYGSTKWVAEKIVHLAQHRRGIPVTITRPATVREPPFFQEGTSSTVSHYCCCLRSAGTRKRGLPTGTTLPIVFLEHFYKLRVLLKSYSTRKLRRDNCKS